MATHTENSQEDIVGVAGYERPGIGHTKVELQYDELERVERFGNNPILGDAMNVRPPYAMPSSVPKAAIIVAHPDDETLWAGGFILEHSAWDWFIGTLCRASDPDRAPKFARAVERLHARGAMLDMDDGPEQQPLLASAVQAQVLALLPEIKFDILLTHAPRGEYTWHRRHVEVCQAVITLWRASRISASALWMFAYDDGGRRYLPRALSNAHLYRSLSPQVWQKKYDLITQVYGFQPDSWEARATPRAEAFWRFESPDQLDLWLREQGVV